VLDTPDIEGVFYLDAAWPCPVYPRFRPQHEIHENAQTSGDHTYLDCECVQPGGSARVEVRFLMPRAHPRCLWIGRELRVCAGSKTVGRLLVTRILDATLEVAPEDYLPTWTAPPGFAAS
jgi:elongation factor Tu